jgi:hypothetical protein
MANKKSVATIFKESKKLCPYYSFSICKKGNWDEWILCYDRGNCQFKNGARAALKMGNK